MSNINLVVTTTETRREVSIPHELLTNMDALLGNLREQDVPLPTNPVLTKSEGGEMILHEEPSFG